MKASSVTHLKRTHRPRLTERIGRVGEKKPRSIQQAEQFGKRRLGAAATTGVLLVAGVAIDRLNDAQEREETTIEACATNLVGHTVELRRHPGDEHLMIPPEIYKEVTACQLAGGDPEVARDLQSQVGSIEVGQLPNAQTQP